MDHESQETKLREKLVLQKIEQIEKSLDDFKDTQQRQNERVEKKIDAIMAIMSTLEILKQSDVRQTSEIFKAQQTANEALERVIHCENKADDALKNLEEHKQLEVERKKDTDARLSPLKSIFTSVGSTIITIILLWILYGAFATK